MAKKRNFNPDPYWSMSELENAIYKIDIVKQEKGIIYYQVYFYSDPEKHGSNDMIVPWPWIIMVDAKSKGQDTIICKCVIDGVGGKGCFGSFETNKKYRKQGYGEKLLRFIISQYNSNNMMVLTNNKPAIALYHKLGFKEKETYTLDDRNEYFYMELEDR